MSSRLPQAGLSTRTASVFASPGWIAALASNANGVEPPS